MVAAFTLGALHNLQISYGAAGDKGKGTHPLDDDDDDDDET